MGNSLKESEGDTKKKGFICKATSANNIASCKRESHITSPNITVCHNT